MFRIFTMVLASFAVAAVADHFFHVKWTAGPSAAGRARITGYVYNDYGDAAVNVALR